MLSHSQDYPTDKIWVDRETRQRSVVEIDDLISSIRKRGILQPLLIQADGKLIFGERRWTTAKYLGLEVVPVRIAEALTPIDAELIELDENRRRKALTWQDDAKAIARLHSKYVEENPSWTKEQSAGALDITVDHFRRVYPVGEALLDGDDSLAKLDTLSAAITTLTRRRSRNTDAVLATLSDDLDLTEFDDAGVDEDFDGDLELDVDADLDLEFVDEDDLINQALSETGLLNSSGDVVPLAPVKSKPKAKPQVPDATKSLEETVASAPYWIEHNNLLEVLPAFSGKKFNFLHLDLPYGVKLNEQANQAAFETSYDSNPEIYWELLGSIADNWNKFMLPSSHFMCWISMEFYEETIAFLEKRIPGLWICKTPLIWHKSDNRGILSDPRRRSRIIYEACLYGSVGDRMLVKPLGNVYSAPTVKKDGIHPNEKPVPMLEHFMGQFVDKLSRVLDPTAGSGSAIRAAERLGAEFGLGLEFDEDLANRAQQRLLSDRKTAALAKKVEGKKDD